MGFSSRASHHPPGKDTKQTVLVSPRRSRPRAPETPGSIHEDSDAHLAADGRVMEILGEHVRQGWLEGIHRPLRRRHAGDQGLEMALLVDPEKALLKQPSRSELNSGEPEASVFDS